MVLPVELAPAPSVPVRVTPAAAELLRELRAEHGALVVLLDDSGCCGPGNVFVQTEAPRPAYRPIGTAEGVPVYADPTFVRDGSEATVCLDVRAAPLDDSLSLEAALGSRFVVRFEAPATT